MTRVIPFHKDHIEPIKEKEKRLTIRYDYKPDQRRGDEIRFMDTDNLLFGSAVVLKQYTMPVSAIVHTNWEYHYSYDSMSDFRKRFNAFYPDVEFAEETELTVVEWGETYSPNWGYF